MLEDKSRELYFSNQQLQESNQTLLTQHSALIRNEKLASIGLLSAGVAHEINNPLAYVSSNLEMIDSYWQSMMSLYQTLQKTLDSPDKALSDDHKKILKELIEKKDLPYITSDLNSLIKDTGDGLLRVKNIVQNLQNFSRTQTHDWGYADINQSLTGTLKILNYQLKASQCQLKLVLNADAKVWCNLGELNQVFLNLVQNALHAMEESTSKALTLISYSHQDTLYIQVEDTGHGINTNHLTKIFDPFFTIKTLGHGTGLGLYISYKIIQDHKGEIEVVSEPDKGTKFIVKLPIRTQKEAP